MRKTLEERFWGKVKKTDTCWLWTGGFRNSYGRIKVSSKDVQAHRFSYKLHYGELPKDMLVCHTCDNRACVNPNHLFLGTPKDNIEDCISKGRYRFKKPGESHPRSKLKNIDIAEIRSKYPGVTKVQLAKSFNVTWMCIHKIIKRQTWSHLP
jgi:hypothetical protein